MNFIFLYGPPAAGKLTVANELSKQLGYKLLDNHRVIDYLAVLFPRSTNEKTERIRSQLGRKIRLDIFEAAARANTNLITTFAPISPGTIEFIRNVREAVEKGGGTFLPVQLLPTREVLLERVTSESRIGKKIDTHKVWHKLVADNPLAFQTFPDMAHCVLDNSEMPITETARRIIEYYELEPERDDHS